MGMQELSQLELAEISFERAQEEFDAQQVICRELAMAIQAVQDFCEDTEHRSVILYELETQQDYAMQYLERLRTKVNAAEEIYNALARQATQA